jgi:hypothetical protein
MKPSDTILVHVRDDEYYDWMYDITPAGELGPKLEAEGTGAAERAALLCQAGFHYYVHYLGFTDSYDYCRDCGVKR